MNGRQLALLGIPAALAVAAIVVLAILVGRDGARESSRPDGDSASSSHARTEPAPRAMPAAPRAPERREPPPAPARPAGPAMPESYARALSGVAGRVVEADGRPIGGLEVTLVELRLASFFPSLSESFEDSIPKAIVEIDGTTTGDDGRFLLKRALPTAPHGVGINLGGPRATLRVVERSLASGGVVDLGDIVLPPSLAFTGRVVNEGGAPIAGARVRGTTLPGIVFQAGAEHLRPTSRVIGIGGSDRKMVVEIPEWLLAYEKRLPIPTATTGEDGRYRLEGLARGLVTVVADREGYVARATAPIPTGDGPEREIETIALSAGQSISGRVVDKAGLPVEGALVVGGAVSPMGYVAIAREAEARSGRDGAFVVTHVPAAVGGVAAAARASAHAPWSVVGPVFDEENLTIELEEPRTLTLLLRGESGEVVPEADVRLRPLGGAADEMPLGFAPYLDLGPAVRRTEPGRYVVEGLSRGSYGILARAAGRGFVEEEASIGDADDVVTLVFPPGRSLAVRVVDDATGLPVEWASVSVRRWDTNECALDARRTDARGLATVGPVPAADGEGSRVAVVVEHPAFATSSIEADPLVSGEVEARLVAGGTLSGAVREDGVLPSRPAMIVLVAKNPGNRGHDAEMPRFSVSDLAGEFRIAHLEPGEYRYNVTDRFLDGNPIDLFGKSIAGDFRPADRTSGEVTIVAGETTRIEIEIGLSAHGPTAFLKGVVRLNGQPLARADVSVWRQDYPARRATTDANGEFDCGEVPAGEVSISVNRRRSDVTLGDTTWESVHDARLELAAHEQRYLEIDAVRIEVGVVVTSPEGSPVEDAAVRANGIAKETSGSHGFATTGPDGRAAFGVRAAGEYQIVAERSGVGRGFTVAEIGPGGSPVIALVLDPGATVAGTLVVEGVTERPEPGATTMLVLQRLDDRGRPIEPLITQLDEDGSTFRFEHVSAGRHRLSVYDPLGKRTSIEVDVPPEGLSDWIATVRPIASE